MPTWLQNALQCEGAPSAIGTPQDVADPDVYLPKNTIMSIENVEKKLGITAQIYDSEIKPNKMRIIGASFTGMDVTSDSWIFNRWEDLCGYSILLWILTLIMCCGTILILFKL